MKPFSLCLATVGVLMAAGSLSVPARSADSPRLPSDDLLQQFPRASRRFDDFSYTPAERRAEASEKVTRVRRELQRLKLDGLVIATERNLNWITAGGKDNVVWVQRESPVKLLITADKQYLIADNIEGPRMMTEELSGLGYEWRKHRWYNDEDSLEDLTRGKRIAFDDPATEALYRRNSRTSQFDFVPVYYPITPGELKKYRWLGRKTAEVLEQVAQVVHPGMTEWDVQYLLAREFWYWDIVPTVLLSAVDDRFLTYRHPVVVGSQLDQYVALNVCTRRWGLTVSTTRLVHFGEPDAKLKKAWEGVPQVMAAMWHASKPDNTLGDAFQAGRRAYESIGYPNEWELHHQGGLILTLERLFLVRPGDKTVIKPGMVLAWNPTVQGTKCEDTVVVKEDGTLENLTASSRDWPTTTVTVGQDTYRIPTVLVRPATQPQ